MPIEGNEIVKGCNKTYRFSLRDKDRNPISLIGSQVLFALRRSFKKTSSIVLQKDSANGPGEVELLQDPNDNQALIKILPTDSVELEEGTYMYSVKVKFLSTSVEYVPLQGSVDIVSSAFDV